MKRLRVTTFNIQHGRNHALPGDVIDLPLMARNALDTNASLFGFNEVRRGELSDIPKFPDTPRILAEAIGGDYVFGKAISLGEGKAYGNAFVSLLPIISSEVVPVPDPEVKTGNLYYETRCMIKAVVDFEGTPVTVVSTHFGLNRDERDTAADIALDIARGCGTPFILMGDLNTAPDDPVYEKLASGLTDAAAFLGADDTTFPSDGPRIRIDYIFVKGFTPLEAHTVRKVVSDHFALTAELGLN